MWWKLMLLAAMMAGSWDLRATGLENTGKPMQVETRCTLEMIQTLGLQCSEDDPCPVFLELTSVEAVGDRLLVSGNLHTAASTIESILLSSENGGKIWTEPHARIAAGALGDIQFFDLAVGWISGHVMQQFPRDAFFLVTADGGKTWRRSVVHGESRIGAIEQFWFQSRTQGTMLMDTVHAGESGHRYELYESQTGGDSWSIRQVDSKPIPTKKPPEAEQAWRLRADGRIKAYRIERRSDRKWDTVASFLVSAGECKPQPPPPVEPAPPPVQPPETVPEAQPVPAPPKAPSRPPSLKDSKPA
jgi:hypothetical protein